MQKNNTPLNIHISMWHISILIEIECLKQHFSKIFRTKPKRFSLSLGISAYGGGNGV
jgi:hypothetical protein